MKKRTRKKEEELRERKRLKALEDSPDGDEDEDVGDDDEFPKLYKNVREEIMAELGEELIGGYYGEGKKKRKKVRRLPAVLSRGECQQVMTAYTKGKWAFRNNLISQLMYTSGVRLAEEAGLNVADLNYEDCTGLVRMGKEGKDRYVCIDPGTMELLKKWIEMEQKKPTDSLFDLSDRQIARIIEGAGEITGIAQKYAGMKRRFSPHSLRHSYATHCYENGMKMFVLKKLMGHEYLGTTLMYVETAMALEREDYMKTGPLSGNGGQVRKRGTKGGKRIGNQRKKGSAGS